MSALLPPPSEITSSPNTSWKIGENQPHPFGDAEFRPIDPKKIPTSYFLGISGVVPRPIAFVSTQSKDGINNLSPFSYFSIVGHEPPTVSIGIVRNRDGTEKDTLNNILETNEFVVNIIGEWMVESANHTCGNFLPEIDEMRVAGLTPLPSVIVKPPRVAESAFHMECKLSGLHQIKNDEGNVTSTVVFGKVELFHVIEPLVEDGPRGAPQIKFEGYRPMGRLGGDRYVHLGNYFEIPRPVIEK